MSGDGKSSHIRKRERQGQPGQEKPTKSVPGTGFLTENHAGTLGPGNYEENGTHQSSGR